jgi:hypothetical protein
MNAKLRRLLKELKDAVAACGLRGEWENDKYERCFRFRARTGEVVNCWPRTKEIQFEGKLTERKMSLSRRRVT